MAAVNEGRTGGARPAATKTAKATKAGSAKPARGNAGPAEASSPRARSAKDQSVKDQSAKGKSVNGRPAKTAGDSVRAKRTTEASPSRREEIVSIAGELFARRGFLGTTIRDIADAANILSGSLYHHFTSKESIADEILSEYWNTLLARYDEVIEADEDPAQTLRSLIRQSVLQLDPFEHAIRLMLNDWSYLATALPYIEENLARIQRTWTEVIRAGIASGVFDSSVDPLLAYRTIMSAITGTGRWYHPGGSLSVEVLSEDMTRIFLSGLTTRGADKASRARKSG